MYKMREMHKLSCDLFKKHITGSRRTACSCSSPKPLQIQETEKNLAEKSGVCYNQHRKILVKPAEGWYEEETA